MKKIGIESETSRKPEIVEEVNSYFSTSAGNIPIYYKAEQCSVLRCSYRLVHSSKPRDSNCFSLRAKGLYTVK